MSTTNLTSLLPPPAAAMPTVTSVVVRIRDSGGERFGFVFLGFIIGVVVTLVGTWVRGLYRYRRAQQAGAAPVPAPAAHHFAVGIPAPGAGEGAVAAASAPPLYPGGHY